jgi:hypothetical protein
MLAVPPKFRLLHPQKPVKGDLCGLFCCNAPCFGLWGAAAFARCLLGMGGEI